MEDAQLILITVAIVVVASFLILTTPFSSVQLCAHFLHQGLPESNSGVYEPV